MIVILQWKKTCNQCQESYKVLNPRIKGKSKGFLPLLVVFIFKI